MISAIKGRSPRKLDPNFLQFILLMIRNLGPGELFDNSSVNPSVLTEVFIPILYPCLNEGDVNVRLLL